MVASCCSEHLILFPGTPSSSMGSYSESENSPLLSSVMLRIRKGSCLGKFFWDMVFRFWWCYTGMTVLRTLFLAWKADTGMTSNQNSIVGFTDIIDTGTGVLTIRTLVFVYTGLASLHLETLALLTLVWRWLGHWTGAAVYWSGFIAIRGTGD